MNNHRDLCILTAKWLLDRPGVDLTSWELKFNRGFVDAIGLTSRGTKRTKKLLVAEVKRTRPDLLQDLRRGKLLKYEKGASHCYLAATPEALMLHKKTKKQIIDDLTSKGLPKYWGILVLPPYGKDPKNINVLRRPRKLREPHARTLSTLVGKIARSFMWRIINPSSPIKEK
jgi:hypothetical protein